MSLNEGLAYIDDKGNRVDYTRPDLPTDIEDLVIDWFNDKIRGDGACNQALILVVSVQLIFFYQYTD